MNKVMSLAPEKKKVLVVEDDESLKNLLLFVLTKDGYEALGVSNGADAIREAFAQTNLLLLLDYQLPDMTGHEIILELIKQGKKVPFIMMTGQGDQQLAVETMKLGAIDYLIKDTELIFFLPRVLRRAFIQVETEKKLKVAEATVKESEAKLRSLFGGMQDLITVIDVNGRYLEIAPTGICLQSQKYSTIQGKTVEEVLPGKLASQFREVIHRVLEQNSCEMFEYQDFVNGQNCWFVSRVSPYSHNSVLWVERNITFYKETENALRDSEARFKLTTRLSGQIVYEYNAISKNFIWDGAIEQVSGYSIEEFREFNSEKLIEMIHPDDRQAALNVFENALNNHSRFQTEYRFKHKEGFYIWIETHCFAPHLSEASGRIMGVMKNITKKKKQDQLIINTIMNTEELERTSFSQEIHDGLGPVLSAMKMYAQLLERPNVNMNHGEIISNLNNLIDEASVTVRDIAFKLSPHVIRNFGLSEALKTYLDKMVKPTQIMWKVDNLCSDHLDKKDEIILYRALCECINNTIKHGRASNISIKFSCDTYQYLIQYTDNGRGFDVENIFGKHEGMGLLNIKNRIKSLNGFFDIQSSPGNGFCLKIRILKKN